MKTIKSISFAILFLGFLFQSCHKGGPWGIVGKGVVVTESKDLKGFNGIDLNIDANVFYVQDSVFKVEISAQQNILNVMKIEVEDRTLEIDYRRNVWDHKEINITVHSPELKKLNVSGSGNITAQNEINTGSIELNVSGSGNINLPSLVAKNLELEISGSGNVKISAGSLDSQDIEVSGMGTLDAGNIVTQASTAEMSGFGNITIHVIKSLKGSITGSGDIRYKGNPVVDVEINGSGRLIQVD